AQSTPPIGQILVEQGAIDAGAVERAAGLQARRKMRIGQILVESGLATEDAIERALAEQKLRKGKRLGQVLVEMGLVREVDLTVTLGHKFQIAVVDLDDSRIDPVAANQVPRDVIEKYGVLPIAASTTNLTVAIADPLAVDAIEVLRFHTKRKIDEVLVTPSQLAKYVASFLDGSEEETGKHNFADLLKGLKADDLSAEIEEEDPKNAPMPVEADSGIVRLVNQIIIDACRRGASDIHVEPNGADRDVGIRFRIDGECSNYQSIPAAYRNQVLARIKIMAGLDISERRKPQDGKIKFKIGNRNIELRVATLPTAGRDEDAVLRILASAGPVPIEKMGMSARNLEALRRAIKTPYGLILCVGPTGSGKTTTLHAALGALNTADTKIWTAEDPVEITQPGLRQVQVSPKIGLTFASTLRAFLRADPDVIMIGEMRDLETASTAVEASLTGHLVLSTLHTNSAPETITRLLDMGLDPFSFADSLVAILAQRLTRALCRHCRTLGPATEQDRAELARACGGDANLRSRLGEERYESLQLYRATGCEKCGDSGYKGRLALHELLVASEPVRNAVAKKASVETIRHLAQSEGMTTLLEDGVEKILSGETDLKQVFAACVK
ncbi:MAG TPA: ATPase, T2SS/T4P/T4SS family, partial [Labilithrix sp.]|nr:ATPase, T2SS/T4P/T4SS family [Labilithrix sp.]